MLKTIVAGAGIWGCALASRQAESGQGAGAEEAACEVFGLVN